MQVAMSGEVDAGSFRSNGKTSKVSLKLSDSAHAPSVKVPTPRRGKPKQLVRKPTLLEGLQHKKHVANSTYYFTSGGTNRKPIRDVAKERTPFIYPRDVELHAFKMLQGNWESEQRKKNQKEGSNFKTRQSEDLRARVHTPNVPVGGPEVRAILDVDPDYYKLVQNRPVNERLNIKKYVNDVRECLRNRIQCGMLQDEALLVQENCYMELMQINDIKEKHKKYADTFDEFLAEDHMNARKYLEEADLMAARTLSLNTEKKELNQKLGMLRCELYILEETWRELKLYQSFLYRIAPLSWRLEYDWIHRDSDENLLQEGQIPQNKLKKEESVLSLDDLLINFMELTERSPEPLIPFNTPAELLETLDALAESTLHSLAHLEKIAGPLAAAKVNAEAAKVQIEAELTAMRRNIDSLSKHIDWEERRGLSLKERGEGLLEGALRNCVAIGPALATHIWVEDCYEGCVAPNDSNLSTVAMARGIEAEMHALCLVLDGLPLKCVVTASTRVRGQQDKMMKEAKEASAKVKVIDCLMKSIERGLEPPRPYGRRRLKPRTIPPAPPVTPPPPPRELTEDEKIMLAFFTDYCPGDDIDKKLEFAKGSLDKYVTAEETDGLFEY